MDKEISGADEDLLILTSDIVSAHVSNNSVHADELPGLIASVYGALARLGEANEVSEGLPEPAVSIRASVKPDYLICLEDGQKVTMLKRYIRTRYNLSPDEYRQRWGLPADYPMTAPAYSERRRNIAKELGLGSRRKSSAGSAGKP